MTTSLSNLGAHPRRDLGIPFTGKDQLTPPPSHSIGWSNNEYLR
jgi:hypothetical protein